MRGFITRSRVGAAVVGVLTAVVFTGFSAVVPGTAAAQCADGVETRLNLVAFENGQKVEVAAERPKPGTCNGNNVYQGMVDSKRAGWRPSVWIIDGQGEPHGYFGTYDNVGTPFIHYDVDYDRQFEMWLCIDDGHKHYCGVGQLAEESSDWDFEPFSTTVNSGH
ncbi:hypothetical protein ACFYOT_03975 [Saccharothrix saharensis]|uniref:hypothetical protein n=1 Tax=Saccharothrix saharensis TaxID=571190 RepID=UPI00367D7954